jgi:hypothetical protein
MICNVFLNMCIVGLAQVGPALYKVEVIDDQRQIHELVCRDTGYVEVFNRLKF